MRRLLLLRHAKSSWDDPALSDHARPLNSRGRKAAAAVAQLFHRLTLAPDLVLVSSARRTLQTLEALSPLPGQPRIEAMLTPATRRREAYQRRRGASGSARIIER